MLTSTRMVESPFREGQYFGAKAFDQTRTQLVHVHALCRLAASTLCLLGCSLGHLQDRSHSLKLMVGTNCDGLTGMIGMTEYWRE